MVLTHQATARWFVSLVLILGACRGGGDTQETGTEKAASPAPEIPTLPQMGPLGDLDPDTDGGAWSAHAGFEGREEFKVSLLQTARTQLPDRAPMVHTMRQAFTLVREVISREDGITRLRLQIKDATIVPMDPNGKPIPPPPQTAAIGPALERVEVHLAIDAQGRVQELEVTKASTLPRGMEEMFHQLVRDLQVALPGGAAEPGQTWDDAGELPVEREKSRNLVRWRLKGTYQGMVDRDGVRCAVVEILGDLEEEGRVDRKGILGRVEGLGRVRKVALLEAETGRLVEFRMVSALARRVAYGKKTTGEPRVEELTMELSLRAGTAGEENQ